LQENSFQINVEGHLDLHNFLDLILSPTLQSMVKKEPAMEIAGLCLPLKPQKEKVYIG